MRVSWKRIKVTRPNLEVKDIETAANKDSEVTNEKKGFLGLSPSSSPPLDDAYLVCTNTTIANTMRVDNANCNYSERERERGNYNYSVSTTGNFFIFSLKYTTSFENLDIVFSFFVNLLSTLERKR